MIGIYKPHIIEKGAFIAGYTEAVMACAVKETKSMVFLTAQDYAELRSRYGHHKYVPSALKPRPPRPAPPPPSGPGTELKALLATIGIVASPTCSCNKMAKKMDEWGQESLNHIEEIVDVMEETAKKRKLPFLRTAGRTLVRIACWKAKRKGNGK
jgi:hypothetical protein